MRNDNAKSKLRGRVRNSSAGEKEDMSGEVECSVWDYCGVHLAESDAVNEWISRAIRVPGAKNCSLDWNRRDTGTV